MLSRLSLLRLLLIFFVFILSGFLFFSPVTLWAQGLSERSSSFCSQSEFPWRTEVLRELEDQILHYQGLATDEFHTSIRSEQSRIAEAGYKVSRDLRLLDEELSKKRAERNYDQIQSLLSTVSF